MKNNPDGLPWIPAKWNAPPGIKAGITTRVGGFSKAPFNAFNIANHVGDDKLDVRKNRNKLITDLNLENEPVWLNQIHENRIVNADGNINIVADGAITSTPGIPCVIMTADCVPLLICNQDGNKIGAIHVGWKGLVAGIVHNAVKKFDISPEHLMVWIGPHIKEDNYEVGPDVYQNCIDIDDNLKSAFKRKDSTHWYANLEAMIKYLLNKSGVWDIYSSPYCTYSDEDNFFSYRRDQTTGRMASMIWMD
jgi:polyphenol oxidase